MRRIFASYIAATIVAVAYCFTSMLYAQPRAADVSIVTIASSCTCSPANRIVIVRADRSDITITLPPATAAGQALTIMVEDAHFTATVRSAGTDSLMDANGATFMGGGTCVAGERIGLLSRGNGYWYVVDILNNHCSNWKAHAPSTAPMGVLRGTSVGQSLAWDGLSWKPAPPEYVITLFSGSTSAVKPARSIWTCINGEGQTFASETLFDAALLTRASGLRNFFAQVNPAPGVGETVTLRIKKVAAGGAFPGAVQPLTITISGVSIAGSDSMNRVDCAPGDMIYLEITGSANCATKNAAWGIEVVGK